MVTIDTDSRVAQKPGQLATPEAPRPLFPTPLRATSLAAATTKGQPLVMAVPTPLTS